MVKFKTKEEVELMKEGGRRLKQVVIELRRQIKVGVKTAQIDICTEELIMKSGGQPAFKKVPNYHWSTCLCLNEQIVHTPPSGRRLEEGDILTLDVGMFYKGFYTDFADTIAIGKTDNNIKSFLDAGKRTLELAINELKVGNRIGQISEVIQKSIEEKGYSIIKELTGHGVGRQLHEDPQIPGYIDNSVEKTLVIAPGLVVAVEVIYAMGMGAMEYEQPSGWSIRTADKSISACFEHTVAVTNTNRLILT